MQATAAYIGNEQRIDIPAPEKRHSRTAGRFLALSAFAP